MVGPGRPGVVQRGEERGDVDRAGAEGVATASGDDDLGDFFRAFKRDPLIGPAIHRRPWARPRRRPWPWEALAWAVTEQLIESSRASAIQRRIVRRWGPNAAPGRPSEEYFASYAPFRALAGSFALIGWGKAAAQGPPLPLAPDELAA